MMKVDERIRHDRSFSIFLDLTVKNVSRKCVTIFAHVRICFLEYLLLRYAFLYSEK